MIFDHNEIIKLLKAGRVGLLPSDTIYGLSCVALNQEAAERIYELKGRGYDKPFIILLANAQQASELGLNIEDLEPVLEHWPAPLTVVVTAGEKTPEYLHRGMNSLAVRVPDFPALREVIRQTGPLVSTSANLQAEKPVISVEAAKKIFGDKLDFYVDVGELDGKPSTLVKIEGDKLKVLRQGAYDL